VHGRVLARPAISISDQLVKCSPAGGLGESPQESPVGLQDEHREIPEARVKRLGVRGIDLVCEAPMRVPQRRRWQRDHVQDVRCGIMRVKQDI
jgi:hypothetical protein